MSVAEAALQQIQRFGKSLDVHGAEIVRKSLARFSDTATDTRRMILDGCSLAQEAFLSGKYIPVLWESEILNEAVNGCEALIGDGCVHRSETIKSETDGSIEVWIRTGKGSLRGWTAMDAEVLISAFVLFCAPEDLAVFAISFPSAHLDADNSFGGNSLLVLPHAVYKWGTPIEDVFMAEIAAMLRFRNMPLLVENVEQKAPRHVRRRDEKAGKSTPIVRIITLRRHAGSSTGEGGTHEYNCRWIVRGHWRKLLAPRKKDNALVTYVHPHVKGPEGKPLKPSTQSVFLVKQ